MVFIPDPFLSIELLLLHYVFSISIANLSLSRELGEERGMESANYIHRAEDARTDMWKRKRDRERLFALLIAGNKSSSSSNKHSLLCDIFPYS